VRRRRLAVAAIAMVMVGGSGVGTDYHETTIVDETVLVESRFEEGYRTERFHFSYRSARGGWRWWRERERERMDEIYVRNGVRISIAE
jgi:hypothetical protein